MKIKKIIKTVIIFCICGFFVIAFSNSMLISLILTQVALDEESVSIGAISSDNNELEFYRESSRREAFLVKDMKFTIIPNEGTDKIKFGMTSEEIDDLLKVRVFQDIETGYENVYGICHVYYDYAGICEGIEFYEPSKVYFDKIQLFSSSYTDAIKYIRGEVDQIKTGIETDYDYCYKSFKYNIEVNLEDEEKNSISSIFIHKQGYYD